MTEEKTGLCASAWPIVLSSLLLTVPVVFREELMLLRPFARPPSSSVSITVGDWSEWLAGIDRVMAHSGSSGLAAVVVVEIRDDGNVIGASVGDCEAWVFADGASINLTSVQTRKPLLGEGAAVPVGFQVHIDEGTVLVATDGLWKYIARARIAEMASIRPLATAATKLVDGVRLRSGTLQDDVAIAICEINRR